ncbi:two-component sensor histidine kinase [Eikenella sp. S3360]|uniref:histidine kinase n=1 Tax=Eikenella glucosivorans TaxID=2766967 RepID=A0ABS0N708_9NEIS|nr:histidine kinase dimerization/phospho-acceptor domain-containing protein [Eikenella glucosivorans]MBH5328091.1 two-component sensor histidine kinase [Eikenella glucosivorans]
MLKYFTHLSLRLFFVLLGILILLTVWALAHGSPYVPHLLAANLLVLGTLAWWLARSISRIRRYAEAMAANRPAPQPRFGDSYLYRLVNAVARLRDELDHRQHIENYVLGLTHELKTPLTAQQAALELLQDSPLSPDQRQLLDRIRRNTENQKQLIARLLELARLENRDSLPSTQTVDLAQLAAQAAQDSRAALHGKRLNLALDCPPRTVQGDPLLLRQALDNLLYNAIDFADAGSEIRIRLTCGHGKTTLAVRNQGTPVPDYALAKIPQRFYSLPRANGKRSSGLGLSFAAEIMRLHQGRLVLANCEGGVEAGLVFFDTGGK